MARDSALSRAKDLKNKAQNSPGEVTAGDVEELLSLLDGEHQEARTAAAGAFDSLYSRPELFEPVARELLTFSAYLPRGYDDIPSPADVFADEDLREVVFIADALARVAQRDPTVLEETTDKLVKVVQSDRNYPKYHLFTLGMVGAVKPTGVPMDEVTNRLCALLDTPTHGYSGWAADTLRRIGNPEVLPTLRETYPDNGDDATTEAFDDAIAELEQKRSA